MASSFKNFRPGALALPNENAKAVVAGLGEVNGARTLVTPLAPRPKGLAAAAAVPFSAPAHVDNNVFDAQITRFLEEGAEHIDAALLAGGSTCADGAAAAARPPVFTPHTAADTAAAQSRSGANVSTHSPSLPPRRAAACAAFNAFRAQAASPSLDDPRVEAAATSSPMVAGSLASSLQSPRPGSDSYAEHSAARRHRRRRLLRAMKLKRMSTVLSQSTVEAIAMAIADSELIHDDNNVVDKRIAAALRDRENDARARQITEDSVQRLTRERDELLRMMEQMRVDNLKLRRRAQQMASVMQQQQMRLEEQRVAPASPSSSYASHNALSSALPHGAFDNHDDSAYIGDRIDLMAA